MTFFYAISEVSHLHAFLIYYSKNQNDKPIAKIPLHDSGKAEIHYFQHIPDTNFRRCDSPGGG